MDDTDGVDPLEVQVDELVRQLRAGVVGAPEFEHLLLHLLDDSLDGDLSPDDEAAFIDHVLRATLRLSDDPRVGRATMDDTVRAHLDRIVARPAAADRLDDRLATLRIGLTFDCDSQHLELVELCREGRALDPLLHSDAERALEVVWIAEEFAVVRALVGVVDGGEDAWRRLGQHHLAWRAAFDALAAIAWNDVHPFCAQARESLLDLLAQPHAALDAAVRIKPAWLAEEGIHRALDALDRIEAWVEAQPVTSAAQDSRFQAVTHAVTSLIWLARDADRSFEVHQLWGGVSVLS